MSSHFDEEALKKRLILGDGNFSYTKGLIEKFTRKHPNQVNLAKNITATEFKMRDVIKACFPESKKILRYLKKSGVSLEFGVDATTIHKIYRGRRFERIQFNHPWKFQNGRETEELVIYFFQSAKHLQEPGDRIQMRLADDPIASYYSHYHIGEASAWAGYKLCELRKFNISGDHSGAERYPGYRHKKTHHNNDQLYGAHLRGNEYIFEKTRNGPLNIMSEILLKSLEVPDWHIAFYKIREKIAEGIAKINEDPFLIYHQSIEFKKQPSNINYNIEKINEIEYILQQIRRIIQFQPNLITVNSEYESHLLSDLYNAENEIEGECWQMEENRERLQDLYSTLEDIVIKSVPVYFRDNIKKQKYNLSSYLYETLFYKFRPSTRTESYGFF